MARKGIPFAIAAVTFCFFIVLPKGPRVMEVSTASPFRKSCRTCRNATDEIRHLGFLKVHKAASTTMQNIFFRFGLNRQLSFVLPVSQNKLNTNSTRLLPVLKPAKGKHCDILAVHSIFNRSLLSSLLYSDTVYIGIVRNPLDTFISSAFYNRDKWNVAYLRKIPRNNFIEFLIKYPEKYDKGPFSLTKNSMAYSFGFPFGADLDNRTKARDYLNYLDSVFRLVLVVEHFDESLVLMKRILNWKLEDILYVPLNSYKHKPVPKLTEDVLKKFRERNSLDYELYDLFEDRLMQQISREGQDFFDEVSQFRDILKETQLFCLISSKTRNDSQLEINQSKWNTPITLSRWDCNLMQLDELDFIEKLRDRQLQNY